MLPFLDLDHLIEEKEQRSIRQLVLEKGEAYFRKVEKETVLSLQVDNHVIALGGGTVFDPESLLHLQTLGPLIYLQCPKSLLKKRIMTPPLPTYLSNEADFERIYSQRIPHYEKIANFTINLENQTEQETLEALWRVINLATSFASPHGANLMAKPSVS